MLDTTAVYRLHHLITMTTNLNLMDVSKLYFLRDFQVLVLKSYLKITFNFLVLHDKSKILDFLFDSYGTLNVETHFFHCASTCFCM